MIKISKKEKMDLYHEALENYKLVKKLILRYQRQYGRSENHALERLIQNDIVHYSYRDLWQYFLLYKKIEFQDFEEFYNIFPELSKEHQPYIDDKIKTLKKAISNVKNC